MPPRDELPSGTANGYHGRFAPSPTGALHLGSLLAAVGSWLRARSVNGRWTIRLEDLDQGREVPGSARKIISTLTAFGLESDSDIVYQSERCSLYAAALQKLQSGGHAFACTCSRQQLGPLGLHQGPCSGVADSRPAWRVRVPDETVSFVDVLQGPQRQHLPTEAGDFVVRRKEGYFAYQLAVVVDDAEQGITEVVRGADLLDSTPRQILLQRLLGLPTPRYLHLPLLVDAQGQKLSKQLRSTPINVREPVPALLRALALLGLQPILFKGQRQPETILQTAVRHFSLERLPRRAQVTVP